VVVEVREEEEEEEEEMEKGIGRQKKANRVANKRNGIKYT
jgi:hypothetical protein